MITAQEMAQMLKHLERRGKPETPQYVRRFGRPWKDFPCNKKSVGLLDMESMAEAVRGKPGCAVKPPKLMVVPVFSRDFS